MSDRKMMGAFALAAMMASCEFASSGKRRGPLPRKGKPKKRSRREKQISHLKRNMAGYGNKVKVPTTRRV